MQKVVPQDPAEESVPDIFWGEIAPTEHLVHFYDDDDVFLDSLEDFVASGLALDDTVILIATPAHIERLEERLTARGIDVAAARRRDYYIALDAEEVLSSFMENGWPDEERFRQMVSDLLSRARQQDRRIRVFGEMVAVLWAQGHRGATVRLEHLWHMYCESEDFSLYCAYPQLGLTQDAAEAVEAICAAHSRVISFKADSRRASS